MQAGRGRSGQCRQGIARQGKPVKESQGRATARQCKAGGAGRGKGGLAVQVKGMRYAARQAGRELTQVGEALIVSQRPLLH